MKIFAKVFIVCFIVAGCTSNQELSKEDAFKILQQEKQFPKIIDFDIFCSDPEFARKAIDKGLEGQGLVKVKRTFKLGDEGKPLIEFTEKAKPYLLPVSEEDKKMDVQKVKIADEDIVEVKSIQTIEEEKRAVVEYTTAYKNISGFSTLRKMDYSKPTIQKANFVLTDEGWKLE